MAFLSVTGRDFWAIRSFQLLAKTERPKPEIRQKQFEKRLLTYARRNVLILKEIFQNVEAPVFILRSAKEREECMTAESSHDLNRSLNPQSGLQKISILIADERPIIREGVMALLGNQADMEIFDATKGVDPNIVLFDFAPSISAYVIAKKYPSAKLVVFTDSQGEEHIYQAIQAGARGYLDKCASLEQILDCIRTVERGQTWIPQQVAELLARRMSTPQLTRREQEVLFQMAQGKSNKQIGLALGLSEGTVKVYMTHILGKLKVSGRLEALAAATARGLISHPTWPAYETTAA